MISGEIEIWGNVWRGKKFLCEHERSEYLGLNTSEF